MFDKNLGYDPASPQSIESYAIQLENKTFLDVVSAKGDIPSDAIEAYANKFRKGGLGNLLEEVYFGCSLRIDRHGSGACIPFSQPGRRS